MNIFRILHVSRNTKDVITGGGKRGPAFPERNAENGDRVRSGTRGQGGSESVSPRVTRADRENVPRNTPRGRNLDDQNEEKPLPNERQSEGDGETEKKARGQMRAPRKRSSCTLRAELSSRLRAARILPRRLPYSAVSLFVFSWKSGDTRHEAIRRSLSSCCDEPREIYELTIGQ